MLGSYNDWKVVDFNTPSCMFKDWCTCKIPCRHFFGVFKLFPAFGWHKLPAPYLEDPRLNIDTGVVDSSKPREIESPVNQHSPQPSDTDPEVVPPAADKIQRHMVSFLLLLLIPFFFFFLIFNTNELM